MPWWRRLLPDTLVGRTLLVLLAALVLTQVAGALLFSTAHMEMTARLDNRQTADRIAGMLQLLEETPEPERGRLVHALDRPGLRVGWGRVPVIVPGTKNTVVTSLQDELGRRLPDRIIHAGVRTPPQMDAGPLPGVGLQGGRPPVVLVAIALEDASWLNFVVPSPANEPLWRPHFFWQLGGGMVVVVLLSLLAVRHAVRPLNILAAAAERLGRDVAAPPIAVSGPREVRAAAAAFNRMQARLRRFVDDRTQMTAAISHDLRTPITRLKLRAEFIEDDEQRLKILADLDEMEAMIASTLAFARDDAAREAKGPIDLAAMLQELCGQFQASYQGPETFEVTAGATGLKRAFANLLENAAKYGGGGRLAMAVDEGRITVTIDDDGPGIPEGEEDRVFAPFYRLETSRNRETGGTGLGLSVARSAVRAHGGDIALANRPGGGLRVTVTLPW